MTLMIEPNLNVIVLGIGYELKSLLYSQRAADYGTYYSLLL